MIREISLEQMTEHESKKYLKKIKIEKFGIARFKEVENLMNFL